MRHFARFTDPGFVRVGASSSSATIRVSAFESPDADRVTLVLLNVGPTARNVHLTHGLAEFESDAFQTTAAEPWKALGSWEDGQERSLPPRSVTTVALTKN